MAEFKYRKKRKEFKEQARVRNNDYREIALTKMGKRQLMLTLLSIFGVTLLSIGSTFAMFTVSSKSAEYNVVKSGTLNISFDADSSSTIGLNGALPTSDSDGLAQTGNTFTITNTGSLTAEYTVSLQDDKDMITQDNCSDKQLDKGFIKYNIDGTNIKLLSDSIDSTIISGSLKAGESKTFTLKLWIKEDATNEALGKHYHGKIVVDANQEGMPIAAKGAAKDLIAKANAEDLDYNSATDAQKKEMWTFTHEATEQTTALTDYRYIGADPNNYVKFNDELWRIIGVFDTDDGTGKVEKRLKIIRNESIGNYTWNYNASGKYINEWSIAQLNNLLNSGAYYNRTTGTYYNYNGNSTTASNEDFTTTGLTEKARAMIGNAKWYLGGTANYTSSSNGLASHFYKYERGTGVYSERSTSWTGKVGLIYLSDYGYATSGGATTNRASCLAKELYNWKDSSVSDCSNNDWMYNSSNSQWTITPPRDDANGVFFVTSTGNVDYYYAYSILSVRPVVHLNSAIKVITGSGTKESPYILSGN